MSPPADLSRTRHPEHVIGMIIAMLACLASCTSNSGGESGPSSVVKTATGGAITVVARDLHFDVGTIKASPGTLTVTLVNLGAIYHTFKIKGTPLYLETNAGQRATGTVTLTTGTYHFECTVPGHAAAGMRGTIQVSGDSRQFSNAIKNRHARQPALGQPTARHNPTD
jgi:plastocyanin